MHGIRTFNYINDRYKNLRDVLQGQWCYLSATLSKLPKVVGGGVRIIDPTWIWRGLEDLLGPGGMGNVGGGMRNVGGGMGRRGGELHKLENL